MELTIINQTPDDSWLAYQSLFDLIIAEAEKEISLKPEYECAVIFVNSATIRLINQEYRQKDESTDVISFAMFDDDPLNSEANILGDIFINVEAVVSQAKQYQHTEKREVGFLFLHGLLHLLGYDHQNQSQEKVMFDLQDKILEGIVKR